jgi:hypothetical protein
MMVNFLGGINSGRSHAIDTQETINFYVEMTGEGSKTGIALIGTPGTKLFVDLAPLPESETWWQEIVTGIIPEYQEVITAGDAEYQTIIVP